MDPGQALTVLTFAGTEIVVLPVGFDVPARLNRLTDPEAERDRLADASATKKPQGPEGPEGPVTPLGDTVRR